MQGVTSLTLLPLTRVTVLSSKVKGLNGAPFRLFRLYDRFPHEVSLQRLRVLGRIAHIYVSNRKIHWCATGFESATLVRKAGSTTDFFTHKTKQRMQQIEK